MGRISDNRKDSRELTLEKAPTLARLSELFVLLVTIVVIDLNEVNALLVPLPFKGGGEEDIDDLKRFLWGDETCGEGYGIRIVVKTRKAS